jgi:hypothetical protein
MTDRYCPEADVGRQEAGLYSSNKPCKPIFLNRSVWPKILIPVTTNYEADVKKFCSRRAYVQAAYVAAALRLRDRLPFASQAIA